MRTSQTQGVHICIVYIPHLDQLQILGSMAIEQRGRKPKTLNPNQTQKSSYWSSNQHKRTQVATTCGKRKYKPGQVLGRTPNQ